MRSAASATCRGWGTCGHRFWSSSSAARRERWRSSATRPPRCAKSLAEELGLGDAPQWHSQRDRIAELASWLSLVTGSLGKFGQDVALMAQAGDEIKLSGGGGSSAMPHKQNPVAAELLVTLARFNAVQLSGIHQALDPRAGALGLRLDAGMADPAANADGDGRRDTRSRPDLLGPTSSALGAIATTPASMADRARQPPRHQITLSRARSRCPARRRCTWSQAPACRRAPSTPAPRCR